MALALNQVCVFDAVIVEAMDPSPIKPLFNVPQIGESLSESLGRDTEPHAIRSIRADESLVGCDSEANNAVWQVPIDEGVF